MKIIAKEGSFEDALSSLKKGHIVSRAGWNGKGQYVKLQVPDASSKMTQPYMYLKNAQQGIVPWTPSQGDCMADDWQVVEL